MSPKLLIYQKECPTCGNTQRWDANGVQTCRGCGEVVSSMAPPKTNIEIIWEPILQGRLEKLAEAVGATVTITDTCVNVKVPDGSFLCTACYNTLTFNLQDCILWLSRRAVAP